MSRWNLGALALLVTVAACEAAPAEDGVLCQTDSACPASQMCRDGQCAATCLSGSVCQTAALPLLGGLSLVEVTLADGEQPTLTAEALFLGPNNDGIDESHALAGSDCVLLPLLDAHDTCGLSAGVITIEGAILTPSKDHADGAADEASLEPVTTDGGKEYQPIVAGEARLAASGTLIARAPGDEFPAFVGQVGVPAPLIGALAAFRAEGGSPRVIATWEPSTASQVVLRLTGPPSADVEAARAALTSKISTESLSDEPRSRTVVCPARDEAGVLVVPASVLKVFTPGRLELSLVRSSMGFVSLPAGDVMVRAAREVRMETDVTR